MIAAALFVAGSLILTGAPSEPAHAWGLHSSGASALGFSWGELDPELVGIGPGGGCKPAGDGGTGIGPGGGCGDPYAIGPKQDDPAPRPGSQHSIGPKQDDPAPRPGIISRDDEDDSATPLRPTHTPATSTPGKPTPGGIESIGPKQDDPAPPQPAQVNGLTQPEGAATPPAPPTGPAPAGTTTVPIRVTPIPAPDPVGPTVRVIQPLRLR